MRFELQPTLQGKHLHLRPLVPEDFDELFAVASDPLIWELHPESTRYQRPVFEKFFAAAIASRGALAVIDASTGAMIGSSRYCDFDVWGNIEIGYTFLARKYWGGSYNRELKSLMLEHAFRFVDEVIFYVGESNLRSRRAVEKIGGKLLRRFERVPAGTGFSVVFSIKKADYSPL
jgi:RimJ/RimL family protein N-acetyltransferase